LFVDTIGIVVGEFYASFFYVVLSEYGMNTLVGMEAMVKIFSNANSRRRCEREDREDFREPIASKDGTDSRG